jgi:hypothetical protein
MLDKLIRKLEKAGKIRKQKAGIVQIEALLKEAILDLEEAKRIVRSAGDCGVTLRLIGGLAIRFHCHGLHSTHLREYHDIDLFGLGKQRRGIFTIFTQA